MPPPNKPPIVQSDDPPNFLSSDATANPEPPAKTPKTVPEEPKDAPQVPAPPPPSPSPDPSPSVQSLMDPNVFMAMMGTLMDKMTNMAMTPTALKEIMASVTTSAAEIAKKAKWPENPEHPHISAYSYPEGDIARPKPKLARQTFFCGIEELEDRLTPGEIEAYNAFTKPREVRGGAWRAVIVKPQSVGAKEKLEIYVPKETVDQRAMLPSLHLILHELNGGPSGEDVMGLLKQIEALKALLATKGATTAELEAAMLA